MPLTFAHPAAVLPLARWLPLSALAVGAVMPDVPYFFPYLVQDRFGHTLGGLFWFCLPAGALMLWGFHAIVKRPLIGLAPRGAQERLAPLAHRFRVASATDAGRIALALLIGAASHVVWDAFTHQGSWGSALIPGFDRAVLGGSLRVSAPQAAQHASTLVGLGMIAVAAQRWYRSAPRVHVPTGLSAPARAARLAGLVVVALAAGAVCGTISPSPCRRCGRATFSPALHRRSWPASCCTGCGCLGRGASVHRRCAGRADRG